jgi:hypothetical protein
MRIRALLLLPLLTAALLCGTAAAAQRVEKQAFAVRPGCTVRLDAYRGAIQVEAGTDDAVHVRVTVDYVTENPAQAEAVLGGFQLAAVTAGNEIRLLARNPKDGSTRFSWDKSERPRVVYHLTVPSHCNLDLQTPDGGITVAPLRGEMRARGDLGAIFFRQVDGSVDAATHTGNVIVSRCTGMVTLKSVHGDVRIGAVGGRASLQTVDGDIEVQTAYAAVDAATANGDVTAGFAKFSDQSRIKTSLGTIRATVNPTEAFSLQAAASFGKVLAKVDVSAVKGGNGRSKLRGTYQGGGPLLDLKASSGNVVIEAGEPLFAL